MPVFGDIIEFNKKKVFKYIKPLGSGGTGDTHLFEDETTEMYFAFKKYAPKGSNDNEETFKRFVDEIKILFNLSHPNIVRIYNYYLYPEIFCGYLQMEYIEGTSIDKFECLFGNDWNDLFLSTIAAFVHLEKNGILHRDIRPSNIMVDKNEEIKVIDFGFGKHLKPIEAEGKSVFLNWPVSELPQEVIEEKKYTHCSEVYFLGKLFKSLPLNDFGVFSKRSFHFHHILEKMCQVQTEKRYSSFKDISLDISKGILAETEFSIKEKNIYQNFADALHGKIIKFNETYKPIDNIQNIVDNLSEFLRVTALEDILPNNTLLINCFVNTPYTYSSRADINITTIKDFYEMFMALTVQKQKIVLDNIYARLSSIKVEEDTDLPF